MKTIPHSPKKKQGSLLPLLLTLLIISGSISAWSQPRPPRTTRPVGAMKITSEIPVTCICDKDTLCTNMTPYHIVEIANANTGKHTITFYTSTFRLTKEISIDSGATCLYKLKKDSTLSDSVIHSHLVSSRPEKTRSRYLPFKQAITIQVKPGIGVKAGSGGANIKLVAGYYVAPKISLGLGTAYIRYSTRMSWEYATLSTLFYPSKWIITRSEYFPVSYVPLFINFTVNFLSKQTTPFFSTDLGVSFPFIENDLHGTVSAERGGTPASYATTPPYYRVNSMKMGAYFGIQLGIKTFISPGFEFGGALGVDVAINELHGTFYNDIAMLSPVNTFSRTVMPAAFTIHLFFGFNMLRQAFNR